MGESRTLPSITPDRPVRARRRDGETVLGRWRLREALGAGSTGAVYRAEATDGGPDVAVKVLHAYAAEGTALRARFRREHEMVRRLRHENIVAFLAATELSDGSPAMVMELARGESLAERMKRGPVPLDEALHVIGEIAAALEHAHARGVVHRDLKPENVIVEGRRVRVVDFGLAKADPLGERPDISLRGEVLGTPRYMSPEQLCGLPVDARADVYALGLIAYELLTGGSPYRAAHGVAGWADRHLFDDPTPVDAHPVAEALPREGRRTLMRALAKSRENRVGSALELADALRGQAAPRRRRPRQSGLWRRRETPRRAPLAVLLAAALLAAVSLLGAFGWEDGAAICRRLLDTPSSATGS